MLHILLLLLKIIGIVLLSLIGLLIVLILLILFVPVRYSLRLHADGQIQVHGRVSWLLHLLHVSADYDGAFGMVVRLLGIPVKRIPEPERKRSDGGYAARHAAHRRERGKQKRKKGEAERDGQENEREQAGAGTHSGGQEGDTVESRERAGAGGERTTGREEELSLKDAEPSPENEEQTAEDLKEDSQAGGKRSFFQRLVQFFRAVRAFFSNILYTIRNICDKIESVRETAAYYMEVLQSDEARRTFALGKRELGKLLRHIAPTKLTGSLVIGMDDPASTGQIIAIVSMFYPIYGNNVSITPDFDEKCLRGSLYLKGRIRAVTLIRIAWRIYFNKDIKQFLHMLKREEKEA